MKKPGTPDLAALDTRLSRIERQNRALWAIVAMLTVSTVGSLGVSARAASPDEPIRAHRFELMDARGVMRGEWFVDQAGESRLVLDGADGLRTVGLPGGVEVVPAR